MSFTRRRPERSLAFVLAAVTVIVVATASVTVSCSDGARLADVFDPPDATLEVSLPPSTDAEASNGDAGEDDASPFHDAARSDAAPPPVVCASSGCATALTTTLDSEGFCALLSDKTVVCWGQNSSAELGRGLEAGTADSPTPSRVIDLSDVVAIEHTCAIDTSGGAWCWGRGPWMRGGAVATTTEHEPVKLDLLPVDKLAVAAQAGCAVVDGGRVQCWGANINGQVAVPGPTTNLNLASPPLPILLPPGSGAVAITAGNATFVLRGDGTLLSWGANPPVGRVSSMAPDPYPNLIALEGVSGIAAAVDNACAVASGIAYCWGSPINLGDYSTTRPPPERKLPEPVFTPEPLVQIATTRTVAAQAVQGIPPIPQRACAVSVTGAVYCWGSNGAGQAGDGTTSHAYSPVKVAGLAGPVARVATTPKTTCALLTSGAIQCWGDGFNGQLGRGRLGTPSLVPQEVLLP